VILPETSILARRKKLRLKDLAGQVLLLPNRTHAINRKVMQMCRDGGFIPKVAHTTAVPHEAGAALVASGEGIYVLPGAPLNFPSFGIGIAAIPLHEPLSMEVHVAWRKGETSGAVPNFLETARKIFNRPSSAGWANRGHDRLH
jgi:DNA-binding transcriptional LysR family regulator